ncbi:hypothetical protein [Streptomyces mirabilis]
MVPSLIEVLDSWEEQARERAEELRGCIDALTGELAGVQERLSRLRITRETVDEALASGPAVPAARAVPAGTTVAVAELVGAEAAVPLAELVPVMLAAQEAGDTTVTSEPYRLILVAFAEAAGPLQCRQVCEAVGAGTEASQVETMRSKLKRLVKRGILAEVSPGLFVLASRAGRVAGEAGR